MVLSGLFRFAPLRFASFRCFHLGFAWFRVASPFSVVLSLSSFVVGLVGRLRGTQSPAPSVRGLDWLSYAGDAHWHRWIVEVGWVGARPRAAKSGRWRWMVG